MGRVSTRDFRLPANLADESRGQGEGEAAANRTLSEVLKKNGQITEAIVQLKRAAEAYDQLDSAKAIALRSTSERWADEATGPY